MSDLEKIFDDWFYIQGGKNKSMLVGSCPNDLIRFGFEEGYRKRESEKL